MENKEMELYFIQFLFCKNRDLLLAEFRPLYDELFKKYTAIYEDGRKNHMDLMDINKKFINTL
jgi:hypothetical protein